MLFPFNHYIDDTDFYFALFDSHSISDPSFKVDLMAHMPLFCLNLVRKNLPNPLSLRFVVPWQSFKYRAKNAAILFHG